MSAPVLAAIDWGSTNARGFLIDASGAVLARSAAPLGALRLAEDAWPGAYAELAQPWREIRPAPPVLIAGMAGSARGWIEAPYVAAPASVAALAAGLVPAPVPGVMIVPGVSFAGAGAFDVMRGEETQIVGALAEGRSDGVLCLPGTHTKWALVAGGGVATFRTSLAGEMFALLKTHSILADSLRGAAEGLDPEGFAEGLAAGERGALLHDLFQVRARALLAGQPPDRLAGYLSGLLLAADVAAAAPLLGSAGQCLVVGAAIQAQGYAQALRRRGIEPRILDGEAAFVRGALAIARAAGLTPEFAP